MLFSVSIIGWQNEYKIELSILFYYSVLFFILGYRETNMAGA